METLLLCEEDINLASVLVEYLRANHFAVDHVTDGKEGMEALHSKRYDLCISEVALSQKDGLSIVEELRNSGKQLPFILLMNNDNKEDILAGYQAGCDDYMVKPFSMDILICKIRALLRRAQMEQDNQETLFKLGDILFDSVKQTLGKEHLSTKENDLLLLLARHANHPVERGQILKSLWQEDTFFTSRSLAVYINHLRHLISSIKGVHIIAIHGKGYKLIIDNK